MNHCDHVDSLLSAYVESEASPAETRFVDEHLALCTRCRSQLHEMRSLLQLLSETPRVQVGDDFTERVLARTRGREPSGLTEPVVTPLPAPRSMWAAPLAAAAAFALVLLATTLLGPRTGGETELALEGSSGTQTAPTAAQEAPPLPLFPEVEELTTLIPELDETEGEVQSMGTARDAYVLEAYELRLPAGGSEPVLTRVSAGSGDKVVVTF
jgi:anti-sigma factor RsiW